MPLAEAAKVDDPLEKSVNQVLKDYVVKGASQSLYFLKDTTVGTVYFFGRQLQAVPSFFRTVRQNTNALALVKDTGRIAIDVGAIVAVKAANSFIQKAIEENTPEEGVIVPYTLMATAAVLSVGVWVWEQRQRLKIALRAFVFLTQQSGVVNQATKGDPVREDFDNHVCDDCSRMRHYKGEFKDWMLFYLQQFILQYGLSSIPYVGKPVAAVLETLLRGQLILSYRLANEGICERHRAVYFREYLELSLSMGMSVEAASFLLAQMVEMLSGVPKEVFDSRVKELVSAYAIWLSHSMPLPPTVKVSTRKNPLALTHLVTSELLEVQIAGVKARAPVWIKMMESDEETIDFIAMIHKCVHVYRDPRTESVLVFFLPEMMLGLKPFFHDEVVNHHWRPVKTTFVNIIDMIDALVAEFVDRDTRGVKGTVIDWANRIEINGSNLTTKAVKYYFNISEDVTKKLIIFFKSPEYKEWSTRLRQELILTGPVRKDSVDEDDIARLKAALRARRQVEKMTLKEAVSAPDRKPDYLPPATIEELDVEDDPVVTLAASKEKESKVVPKVEKKTLPIDLQSVITGTAAGLNAYKQGFAMNDIGEKRRNVYRSLLRTLDTDAQKLLVCYALYTNKEGSTLWHTVRDHITEQTVKHDRYLRDAGTYVRAANWAGSQTSLDRWVEDINQLANHASKKDMYAKIGSLAEAIKAALPSEEALSEDEFSQQFAHP